MPSRTPPLGIYIHVPYCTTRCGYCDFNTYVPNGNQSDERTFVAAALQELTLARTELGARQVSTVFIGGGTPTLLGADGLTRLLDGVAERFDLAPDAEVTTEANPESVDPDTLRALKVAGFTRISIGMQSNAPHVLKALDRVHTPGRAVAAAHEARAAGFEHVSLDLIYGTPGETDEDWQATLEAALSTGPDHVSAYALTVEPGTALAARVRRRTTQAPDDEAQARRFHAADTRLSRAGLHWYEVSSWASHDAARCRHNIGYWRSDDWWGIGPGAHSHVAGTRWSNVLRPADYAKRLAEGRSPAAEREVLTAEQRQLEAIMLGIRTRDGLPQTMLTETAQRTAAELVTHGRAEILGDRVVLTAEGRLFATAIARDLSS